MLLMANEDASPAKSRGKKAVIALEGRVQRKRKLSPIQPRTSAALLSAKPLASAARVGASMGVSWSIEGSNCGSATQIEGQ